MFEQDATRRREIDEPGRRGYDDRRPEAGRHPLLDLQRSAGNQAVGLLVQRAPKETPAPTDAPGSRPKPAKPAPQKAAADIHARVLKFEVDQGHGYITISAGSDQGVKVGMAGALLEGDKETADFTEEKVTEGRSWAHVAATQDQVGRSTGVLIKASKFKDEDQTGKEF
ncbi:MAG TPA: hypothetical protein VKR30_02695 [Candidatus Limnocylindrales bacterium]|nr:hypothetical protein [Candidatus Limnocylindrales bacterium]